MYVNFFFGEMIIRKIRGDLAPPPGRPAPLEAVPHPLLGPVGPPRPTRARVSDMRQAISNQAGCPGSSIIATTPPIASAIPIPPSRPAGYLSDSVPASGATTMIVSGQGVITAPTSAGVKPYPVWSRK